MKIGENTKVKGHPFCWPANRPYIGQAGVIIAIPKPKQYRVQFVDDYEAVFFEGELETGYEAQKNKCVNDCLGNDDETKEPFLKAVLTLCLQELDCV